METPAVPKPRRRLVLSLRLLMGLVLVVGCGLGLWVRSAAVQRRAVDLITRDFEAVVYDYETLDGLDIDSEQASHRVAQAAWRAMGDPIPSHVRGPAITPFPKANPLVRLIRRRLGPDYVHGVSQVWSTLNRHPGEGVIDAIADLPGLTLLHLSNARIEDQDLWKLRHLSRLKGLRLYNTKITDAGLAHLANFPRLRDLDLGGTQMTDAGLAWITPLRDLEVLSLREAKITDAGMVCLGNLTRLRQLDLIGTRVTEAALDRISHLIRLEHLDLSYPLSAGGLKKLQAFPHLESVTFPMPENPLADFERGLIDLRRALPDLRINGLPGFNEASDKAR